MRRFEVEILPEAEAEIRAAFRWYVARSQIAADSFRSEVFAAIDGLEESGDTWASDEDGIRRYFQSPFPYTVYYKLLDSCITVFAVGHQRRKPRYWEAQ